MLDQIYDCIKIDSLAGPLFPDEEFRDVVARGIDYEGIYQVTNYGRIWDIISQRWLTITVIKIKLSDGSVKDHYCVVGLMYLGVQYVVAVHTIVLESFVGPCPEFEECRHLDGNKQNNRLYNLKWGTRIEQYADRVLHGTDTKGKRNGRAKLIEGDVREIRRLYATGEWTWTMLAWEFDVSDAVIGRIVNRQSWKHVL